MLAVEEKLAVVKPVAWIVFAVIEMPEPAVNGACTSKPIRKPRLDLASAAFIAPVPPFSIETIPVKAAASRGRVMLDDPSKGTPLIVRGVSRAVAFAARFAELAWLA